VPTENPDLRVSLIRCHQVGHACSLERVDHLSVNRHLQRVGNSRAIATASLAHTARRMVGWKWCRECTGPA
jgi:hypothetical protein